MRDVGKGRAGLFDRLESGWQDRRRETVKSEKLREQNGRNGGTPDPNRTSGARTQGSREKRLGTGRSLQATSGKRTTDGTRLEVIRRFSCSDAKPERTDMEKRRNRCDPKAAPDQAYRTAASRHFENEIKTKVLFKRTKLKEPKL